MSVHLFVGWKVRWNDDLVSYFSLMYHYGIKTNILHLKSDSHVSENFCQINFFPSLFRKKIENKSILKLQNLFS